LVIVALGLALAVLILALLWFTTDVFRGTGTPASEPASDAQVSTAVPAPTPAASPTAATSGPVVLTAADEVWLRVYDAANTTLYLGTMKPGEQFEVPANANEPMVNVGRPDKLRITVGGRAVPPLGDGSRPLKDVRISAAALSGGAASGATGAAPVAAAPTATPARATSGTRAAPLPPAFSAPSSDANEAARANRAAADAAPVAAGTPAAQ
ncbi:RodZ domain-containing protein, partial [Sphingomonas sp.]|uniref:DUF4115 domain-containing protein n=1 Tax=Sphingomonas sp. TaxID=28214 RepID=UPI0035C7955F